VSLSTTVRRAGRSALDAAAAALATATLAGLALETVRPGSEAHVHWMGSFGAPELDRAVALVLAALVLGHRPLRRSAPRLGRVAVLVAGAAVSAATLAALVRHVVAFADGRLMASGHAPPATLVALAIVAAWTARAGRATPSEAPRAPLAARAAVVAVAGAGHVLAWMGAVASTDYRGPADAVLVLGAKVDAEGRPSGALVDRVRTACALRRDGHAPVLVLSGGHGRGAPVDEPEAMRRLAREEGVPEEAIVLDEGGVDTEASLRFAADLAEERGWRTVLVVSHDYHLARIRLHAARLGLCVRTVPATETCSTRWKAAATLREVAAFLAAWVLDV
jgi:uncharacterized SAM-binding protein YcdF (DUF218 family)